MCLSSVYNSVSPAIANSKEKPGAPALVTGPAKTGYVGTNHTLSCYRLCQSIHYTECLKIALPLHKFRMSGL